MKSVYCAVRIESLNKAVFKGLNCLSFFLSFFVLINSIYLLADEVIFPFDNTK